MATKREGNGGRLKEGERGGNDERRRSGVKQLGVWLMDFRNNFNAYLRCYVFIRRNVDF